MSYSSFSDNDDDLFSDSPSSTKSYSSNPTDEIQSLIDSIDSKDIDHIDSMLFRSKVALTLLDGSNSFIFEINSYNRTIFNTLNSLTNNLFQYQVYAETLEESIVRRLIIRDFLLACVDETDDKFLQKLSEVVEVNIDKKFLVTYFESILDVMNFVIDDNIELYKKVCFEAKREPMLSVIEKDVNQVAENMISSSSYINNIFKNIKHSLGHGYFQ
jgi:hypothetical protein